MDIFVQVLIPAVVYEGTRVGTCILMTQFKWHDPSWHVQGSTCVQLMGSKRTLLDWSSITDVVSQVALKRWLLCS
jgi:hypothetical protein